MAEPQKPLIFGHIHKKETRDEIRNISTKKGEKLSDLLKYKLSRPTRTILLLDGMDEYNKQDYLTSLEFWQDLNSDWNILREQLGGFNKVIIAVREQFLQNFNEARHGLNSYAIDGKPMQYLKLQPFKDDQINQYIKVRFKLPKEIHEIEKVVHYFRRNELNIDGEPLLGIPLILSYVQDLSIDALKAIAEKKKQKIVDRYDIYSIIIEKWLTREQSEKAVSREELKLSVKFCEELAFKLATNSINKIYAISERDFLDLENSYFSQLPVDDNHKSFITHLGDRSLLLKEGMGNQSAIRFAHASFMEYFLASFAFRLNKNDNRQKLSFDQIEIIFNNSYLTFAVEMLLSWGWNSIKTNEKLIPLPHKQSPASKERWKINEPSLNTLNEWLVFIESISPYKSIRKILQENFEVKLKNIDPFYHQYFAPLKDLCISNLNFFRSNIIPNEAKEFVYYFKSFVAYIDFVDKPINDDDLKCFDGIENLKILCLEVCNISGRCFNYFIKGKHKLEELLVTSNDLMDEDLSAFSGFSNLKQVALARNKLTGSCLKYFEHAVYKIDSLDFDSNLNLHNDMSFLTIFSKNNEWRTFGLSNIDVSIIVENFLQNASMSVKCLSLTNTGIDDEWLKDFFSYVNVTDLSIGRNHLTGRTFDALLPLADKLNFINLSYNELDADSLKIFTKFSALKKIVIFDCPKQNPSILNELKANGISIFS